MKKDAEDKRKEQIRINKEYSNIVLALTGAITSPKDAVKALAHVISGGIQGRTLKNFQEAWHLLTKKGSINAEYIESPWAEKQFNEVLKELNKRDLDEQRVEALVNVFLNSAKQKTEGIDAIRVVEIMKLISKLDAVDIYILEIINNLRLDAISGKQNVLYVRSAASWEELILQKSKLEVREITSNVEDKLIKNSLISPRELSDNSAVQVNSNYRLTEFGIRVCSYMSDPLRN